MKKMLKRLCTGFLALATVVTALPTTPVYIIERLVLSHIFYFNRYNSCLSPCIFVVFITCVIYNPHGPGLLQ